MIQTKAFPAAGNYRLIDSNHMAYYEFTRNINERWHSQAGCRQKEKLKRKVYNILGNSIVFLIAGDVMVVMEDLNADLMKKDNKLTTNNRRQSQEW